MPAIAGSNVHRWLVRRASCRSMPVLWQQNLFRVLCPLNFSYSYNQRPSFPELCLPFLQRIHLTNPLFWGPRPPFFHPARARTKNRPNRPQQLRDFLGLRQSPCHRHGRAAAAGDVRGRQLTSERSKRANATRESRIQPHFFTFVLTPASGPRKASLSGLEMVGRSNRGVQE